MIIFALLIPCIIALSFAEPFLLFIKQEPTLAHLSGQAMRSQSIQVKREVKADDFIPVSVWQAPFLAIFELSRKYLLAVSAKKDR